MKGHVDDHVLHVHVQIVPTMLSELHVLYPLQDGNTPLHLAAMRGLTTFMEHLLSTPGIFVNDKDKVSWSTEFKNKMCTVIGTVSYHVHVHVHVYIVH